METQRTILWTVTDPRGLNISLADDVWQAITSKHPELTSYLDAIRITAQDPDEIYFDAVSTKQRMTGAKIYLYYKRNVLMGDLADKYMTVVVKVVMETAGAQGYVETAWPPGRIQPRLVLEWKK